MIHFINIAKSYATGAGVKVVLRPTSLSLPTNRRIGVLGRNGAGKTTLLSLIAGTEYPDQGQIISTARLSWPLGFGIGLHNDLTGVENIAFVARINETDIDEAISFVTGFAELGDYLRMPVRTYSQGMRARLAFGISMAIRFDCYLVDELTGVGDKRFQERCRKAFEARSASAGMLYVSHSERSVKQYCDSALVLYDGRLVAFEDIDEAIRFYNLTAGS